MKAVFNSAPIIFLTKLGIIEAASDLFDRIDIPSLVCSEIRRKPDASAEAVGTLLKEGAFWFPKQNLKAMGFRISPELFWKIFSGIDQKR